MLIKNRFIKTLNIHYLAILILIMTTQIYSAPSQKIPTEPTMTYSSNNNSEQRKFIIVQLFDDVNFLFHQPDFYGVVGGIMLTPKLFDKPFKQESPEFTEMWGNSQIADNLFAMGEIIGDGQFAYALSLTSYGIGKIAKKESLQSFGTDLFRAQTINAIFVLGIKGIINRQRPNGSPYSYPSGHTSSAFATAGVIYRHFGKNWGIPAFILASYVGLSRLQENKHYLTDIIAGGVLGSYLSLKIIKTENKSRSLSIIPYMNVKNNGLSFFLKF